MFKLLGAVVVLLSAVLFGIGKYNTFFERKRVLSELLDGTRSIEMELRCTCAPLYDCFLGSGDFYKRSASLISQGLLPEEAVKTIAYETPSLKNEDLKVIERFAVGLCAKDCEGQLSNLAIFGEGLKKQLENAEEELDMKGKLCVKGSILTAAAIVLLII